MKEKWKVFFNDWMPTIIHLVYSI